MRLTLPMRLGFPLVIATIWMRVFYGLAVDMPEIYGAKWIAALGGLVLCIPIAILLQSFTRANGPVPTWDALESTAGRVPTVFLGAILAILAVYEAATASRMTSNSASYVALEGIPTWLIYCTLLFVCMYAAWKNGQSLGSTARLWLKIAPWILVIVVLMQARSLNLSWLFPIWGAGIPELLDGMRGAAGWIAMWVGMWLVAQPEKADCEKKGLILGPLLASAAVLVLLLLLNGMIVPPTLNIDTTRAFQLDSILANGRVSLMTQLPLLILWFNGLLFSVSFALFVAAALLQRILPKLDGRISILICTALLVLIAFFRLADQQSTLLVAQYQYLIVAAPLLVVLLIALIRKGGKARCAQSD